VAVHNGRVVASPVAQSYLQPIFSSQPAALRALTLPTHSELPQNTLANDASTLVFTLDAGLGTEYETACAERVRQEARALADTGEEDAVMRAQVIPAGSGAFHINAEASVCALFLRAAKELPFVLSVDRPVVPRTTQLASPYGMERTMRLGPITEGLNPDLTVPHDFTLQKHGVTGVGVTIAIGDTGLWVGHCRYASMSSTEKAMRTCAIDNGAGNTCSCLDGVSGSRVSYIKYSCDQSSWCGSYATDWHALHRDHGTHVASLALAAAPSAKLVMLDLQSATQHSETSIVPPPNIYDRLLSMPYNCENARVFSFSWAGSYDAQYSSMDRTFDHFAYNHPTAVILAAAGNEGYDGPGSVGSPSTAKNVIAVGALVASRLFFEVAHGEPSNLLWQNYWKGSGRQLFEHPLTTGTGAGSGTVFDRQREIDNAARGTMYWSSRGPTADGRRKPDISVPGASLLGDYATGAAWSTTGSCSASETTDAMQGTSMATPLLAGVAAVLLQLFDACDGPMGCELNHSALAGVSADARLGELPASAVRAIFVAASAPSDAIVDSIGYWDHSRYMRRLYRMTDSASLQSAAAGAGFGEVQLGRRLLPHSAQSLLKLYVFGETYGSGFVPLAAASSTAPQGVDILLAAQYWSGDSSGRSFCFVTTSPHTRVVAALAWPEYPSLPNCNPCLQSDLALGIYQVGSHVGGAAADTANNAERVEMTVHEEGSVIKVMVYATQISPAVQRQQFSVVVSGDVTRTSDCAACSLGSESVPCVSAHGIGETQCGQNTTDDACTSYSTCFALASDGSVLHGTTIFECGSSVNCLPVMFPAAGAGSCTMYSCDVNEPVTALAHGAGTHRCPRGYTHECINMTTGRTVISARCLSVTSGPSKPIRQAEDSTSSQLLLAAAVVVVLLGCASAA